MAFRDENVEAVRAARESLVRKFRGLRGWFRHLEERDRRRAAQPAADRPRGKKTKTSTGKS
jgi:hypothetical protein